jgi:hypothetical protein
MKLPMTLWELAIGAAICLAVGFAAGYNGYDSRIEDCHTIAEQHTNYGQPGARAFEFAVCVSPRRYDPQYDYKRFKGK